MFYALDVYLSEEIYVPSDKTQAELDEELGQQVEYALQIAALVPPMYVFRSFVVILVWSVAWLELALCIAV